MSATSPRGAPASTHLAIVRISSSLSDGSFLNSWMPMFFSTVPRRHHAGAGAKTGPLLDGARPRARFVVGPQRHRRHAVGTMAVFTAALKYRGDVFGERDFGCGVRRCEVRWLRV